MIDISSIVIAVISIVTAVISSFFSTKERKKATLVKVLELLPKYVAQAEALIGAGHGEAKLLHVLNLCAFDCLKNNIQFDESYWTRQIESVLASPEKKGGEISEKKNDESIERSCYF